MRDTTSPPDALPLPADPAAGATPQRQGVVLLHGLARSPRSMQPMALALDAAGYLTANVGYPSRRFPIERLALQAVAAGIDDCTAQGATQIHFVTHSLGGILVRAYLARRSLTALGRVVMLSPPNRGSEAAEALRDRLLYRWFNGPAGQQLGTGPDSLPLRLGAVGFPLGIITGDRVAWIDRWMAGFFVGQHDGKVAVARAGVDGMDDLLVLPYSHPFIMNAPEVAEQTMHFLAHGRFARDPARHPRGGGAATP